LVKIFHKTPEEAQAMMMTVHKKGHCAVGVYSYDIAVTKKLQAEKYAGDNQFPLKLTVEVSGERTE
jgi:ATP-dependent Clp protease adaptor protein ClpS